MFSALTNLIGKDLKEFAAVVTADTKHLLDGGECDKATYAGDEHTADGTLFDVPPQHIREFQSDRAIFTDALCSDESVVVVDKKALLSEEHTEQLLERSEIVRRHFEELVGSTAASADEEPKEEGSEKGRRSPQLSRGDFFHRYFVRLHLFRRDYCRAKQQLKSAASEEENEKKLAADGGADDDDDWGLVSDAKSSKPTAADRSGGIEGADAGGGAGGDTEQRHYQQQQFVSSLQAALKEKATRVTELERLVASLSGQVRHLQSENETLRRELADRQQQQPPLATSPPSSADRRSSAGGAASSSSPTAAAQKPQEGSARHTDPSPSASKKKAEKEEEEDPLDDWADLE